MMLFLIIVFVEPVPEEVLRSYSSVKGHRTRVEREITNLLELLHTQYSSTSELCIFLVGDTAHLVNQAGAWEPHQL